MSTTSNHIVLVHALFMSFHLVYVSALELPVLLKILPRILCRLALHRHSLYIEVNATPQHHSATAQGALLA
jgi:DNA-binding GntR family transcriptional regulator